MRYRLLETIRQYAAGAPRGRAATRPRSGAATPTTTWPWPRPPARTCGAATRSSGPQRVLRDTDNFRAVLDWAIETPSAEHALRLVAPLTVTGMAIGEAAEDWAETAIEIPGGDGHPLFSVVVAWAALGVVLATTTTGPWRSSPSGERADLGHVRAVAARARGVLALFLGSRWRPRCMPCGPTRGVAGRSDETVDALLLLAARS